MSNKDIDFSKVSLPADDFDTMMRQALGTPPPVESSEEAGKSSGKRGKATPKKPSQQD